MSRSSSMYSVAAVALAGAASVAVVAPAMADGWLPKDGMYGSIKGGAAWVDDHSYSAPGGGAGIVETKLDDGLIGTAALGVKSGIMRYELEGIRQESDVKAHTVGGTSIGGGGKTTLSGAMGNVYIDLGEHMGLKPYIGGGAGYARVGFENFTAGGVTVLDEKDDVFAYQGMAGVSYDLNPHWALTAEYRYLGANDAKVSTVGGGTTKVSYDSNNVLIGARYTF